MNYRNSHGGALSARHRRQAEITIVRPRSRHGLAPKADLQLANLGRYADSRAPEVPPPAQADLTKL